MTKSGGQVVSEFSSFEGVKSSVFVRNAFIDRVIDCKIPIPVLKPFFEALLASPKAFLFLSRRNVI